MAPPEAYFHHAPQFVAVTQQIIGQFEIAFSDLQASPRYPGGLALRLARVKRYREDKSAAEADTMASVRRLYTAQSGSTEP